MSSPPTARNAILFAALVLTATSCSLNPKQDPSQFYVLTAAVDASPGVIAATGSDLIIGLGPVVFPGYLDRPQMVTRLSQNQVSLSEYERWAESLSANFTTVLARNLEGELGPRSVFTYPWFVTTSPHYAVEVAVSRFERNASGGAELRCRWSITDPDGKVVATREATYRQPASDATTAASVAALSRTIDDLSADISTAIRQQRGN